MNKIQKFLVASAAGALMFGSLAVGAFAATQDWNLTGNWKLDYSLGGVNYDTNLYDVTLSQTAGTLTGTGQYPDPGPYSYAWDVAGSITGNNFTLTDTYTLGAIGTVMHMTGTVASDGTISGTWDDNYGGGRTGTWKTISGKAAPICTQTGFFRDGINMKAAQIGGDITGILNANGCDIGVYYGPGSTNTVSNAEIYGAKYFGVVNRGGSVDVKNSDIHNIGDNPFTGGQYGLAVYFGSVDAGSISTQPACTSLTTSGTVDGNNISQYQKGGVVVVCDGASAKVTNNSVTGLSTVPFIAQNGIQFGYGAQGEARGNTIDGNWYSGVNWTSTGILLFDINAKDVKTSDNKYLNNQTNHAVVTSQSCPKMYGGFYQTYGLCLFP